MNIRTHLLTCIVIFAIAIGVAHYARAADAPPPSPTIESVTKERDELRKENGELKSQVAQWHAAFDKAVQQRNDLLQFEINTAVAGAAKKQN